VLKPGATVPIDYQYYEAGFPFSSALLSFIMIDDTDFIPSRVSIGKGPRGT
jgi:hypothetical protein